MKFKIIASQSDGRVIERIVEAKNKEEVFKFLSLQNLRPIKIEVLSEKVRVELSFFRFKSQINLTDQIFITKYLSLMLRIGTGLLEAVNILIQDFNKYSVKNFLLELRDNLEKGNPFYVTFSHYPKVFNQVYINMIKAGETSGNLEKILEDLTELLTKQKDLRDQIKSALIYPILLLVGSILVLLFLVLFALPKIAEAFLSNDFKMPLFSKIVFSIGLFLNKNIFYFLAVVFILIITFIVFYKTSVVFKRFIFSIFSELPMIKDLVKKFALQRFASLFSSLIKSGVSVIDGLEITAQAVGHTELKSSLIRIAREGLSKGLTMGEAFKRESFFPRTVVNLIAISEKAGHTEEVLQILADFYSKEIDNTLKRLVTFLEPILLLFIGLVIAMIALAIIVPIYQLTTSI